MTTLDHIITSLKSAGAYNRHDAAAPAVILWTDGAALWKAVASRIGECMERFYILNPEVDGKQSGPSTWIRYKLSADEGKPGIPVVYLPGVSRQAFRSAAGFPEEAKHLFALQYLGQFWTQLSSKDWTPAAMLSSSDGGLGLDLAKDQATAEAVLHQLAEILETPVAKFQGKRLEASDFNSLSIGDADGMLLRWLSDPEKADAEWSPEKKRAFKEISRQKYGFDPEAEGRIGAAEKLVAGGGEWENVWRRFEEAPAVYRAIRSALDLVKPEDLFGTSSPRLPQTNHQAETRLRDALMGFANLTAHDATEKLQKLAGEHGSRASSVWAQLGEAPLAQAVLHLGRMVKAMQAGLPGTDWASLSRAYLENGWHVDAEARKAYSVVRSREDMDAITKVLQCIYLPWLTQLAERVQGWAADYPNISKATARNLCVEPGTVYLFVDGLRADVALELIALLEASGISHEISTAWSALPTVTATAKPAWLPLASKLNGEALSEKFEPQVDGETKALSTEAFRTLVGKLGLSWFPGSENGDPSGCGWTEAADFDSRGHEEGGKLAWRIQEELTVVRQRISELLQSGWKRVVVVTDHGWLWLPGGLPKTELPQHLTASKWGRCAVPKPEIQHRLPTAPWFWANHHHLILAPGATGFRNGIEYAHGGMTLHEALTLTIRVDAGSSSQLGSVAIQSHFWRGLRLDVEVEGETSDLFVDLRRKAAEPASSLIGKTSQVRGDGKASLVIMDDDLAGSAATLVVLKNGEVVAKSPITIGEN